MLCQDYQSSLQGLFRDISLVSGKLARFVFLYFAFRIFLVKYIILSFDIAVLVTPNWEMLSRTFVNIWSIRVEVLQVILVGLFINCLRPCIEQNSVYFLISSKKSFQWFFILWVLLKMNLSFNSKSLLKSLGSCCWYNKLHFHPFYFYHFALCCIRL